jgi:hypothetical protein
MKRMLASNFVIGTNQNKWRASKKMRIPKNRFAGIQERRGFVSLFGVTSRIFDYLLHFVQGKFEKSKIQDKHIVGATLQFMKNYDTFRVLGLDYGISFNQCRNLVLDCAIQLTYSLQDEIGANYKEKGYFFVDLDVVSVVDVSKIRILKPTELQRRYYSSEKNFHAINCIVVTDINTKILYVAVGFFRIQHNPQRIRLSNVSKFLSSRKYLLGDSAFRCFNWCLKKNKSHVNEANDQFNFLYNSKRKS